MFRIINCSSWISCSLLLATCSNISII